MGFRRFDLGHVALKGEEGALEHGAVGGAGGALQLVERARAGEFERGETLPARALLGRESPCSDSLKLSSCCDSTDLLSQPRANVVPPLKV
jgi:hypothetical protein